MRAATAALAVSILGLSAGGLYAETKPAKPDTQKKAGAPAAAPQAPPLRPQIPDNPRSAFWCSPTWSRSAKRTSPAISVPCATWARPTSSSATRRRNWPTSSRACARATSTSRRSSSTRQPCRATEYDTNGLLHLNGYYKTEPQRVQFDLVLQPVGGMWRLYGISVGTVPAPTDDRASAVARPDQPTPVPAPKRKPSKAKPN